MRASGALVQVFQTRSGAAQPSRTTSVLTSLLLFSVCCCTHLAVAAPASAALPPETRKELTELQKQLKETTALLKKNEVEKVREILDSVEKRVTELAIPEDEKDRAWTTLKTALEKAKYAFPVSFEKEVAPIVKPTAFAATAKHRPRPISGSTPMPPSPKAVAAAPLFFLESPIAACWPSN